jgi:precorrin-3B C17-methyltransferase
MSKVIVVGIGPGEAGSMTGHCLSALRQATVLCGYDAYIALVQPLFPDKPAIATGMTQEVERCRLALDAAAAGETVAVVCSGDAGVYGMAGLVLQLAVAYPAVEVDIVPGVSAAMAGAAVLGAPLMHDFAVVSLSDLLTPWERIAARLDGATAAGFVICLYNPASRKRHDYLAKACDIVLRHRAPATVCGWVRNIGRDRAQHGILTLAELRDWQADMFTTIFIGSEDTRVIRDRMVTPRGYAGLPQ